MANHRAEGLVLAGLYGFDGLGVCGEDGFYNAFEDALVGDLAKMIGYPVSQRVNNPRLDDNEVIKPLDF